MDLRKYIPDWLERRALPRPVPPVPPPASTEERIIAAGFVLVAGFATLKALKVI